MNKLILAAAAAVVVATPLVAQQAAQPDRSAGTARAAVEAQVRAHFARADANSDGFVTREEGEALRGKVRGERHARRGERRDALFARLDVDKNGQISRAEFDAQHADRADRHGRRMERMAFRAHHGGAVRLGGGGMFDRLDADRDARVSLAEATGAALRRFDMADADRDGIVTREERRAVRAAHHGKS
jgi:hypothetical protein